MCGLGEEVKLGLFFTVLLGLYFTFLQAAEYLGCRVYGTTFFVATGFHGLHVTIGRTFLLVCLVRHFFSHFRSYYHLGFEAAA